MARRTKPSRGLFNTDDRTGGSTIFIRRSDQAGDVRKASTADLSITAAREIARMLSREWIGVTFRVLVGNETHYYYMSADGVANDTSNYSGF